MSQLDRRQALAGLLGVATVGWLPGLAPAQPPPGKKPNFSAVHPVMEQILKDGQVAGASLAVAYRGQMVIWRGYGLADVEKRKPVTRDTLFCTASVTKPITALGVLKLVEENKLDLDTPVVKVLSDLKPLPGKKIVDPRFQRITARHLLYHTAGLQRDIRAPAGKKQAAEEDEVDYRDSKGAAEYQALMSRPLESAPGTTHHYSNAGFLVLRVVIEKVSGQDYEKYIREKILAPMGIRRMHLEKSDYEPAETRRYQAGGRKPAVRKVANWLAPAGALVKFISAVAGSGGKPFLSRKLTREMLAAPAPPWKGGGKGRHPGLGWDSVGHFPAGVRFSKNGGKPGVSTWLEHLEFGVDWALLLNTSPLPERSAREEARRKLPPLFRKALGLPAGKGS